MTDRTFSSQSTGSPVTPRSRKRRSRRQSSFIDICDTPFGKTPKAQLLVNDDRGLQVDSSSADLLLKSTFNTYLLTPLINYSYQKLKNHKTDLALEIEAEVAKELVFNKGPQLIEVVFERTKGLSSEQGEHHSIWIKVQNKSRAQQKLLALLCCSNANEDSKDYFPKAQSTLHNYPLLLSKGPMVFIRGIQEFFQKFFGSFIKPLKFSPLELSWMLGKWTPVLNSSSKDIPVKMAFSTDTQNSKTIEFTVSQDSALHLWRKSHQQRIPILLDSEVEKFLSLLRQKFLKLIHIDINKVTLLSVSTPIVSVHHDGKIKIHDMESIPNILAHIGQLAEEKIFWFCS